MSSMELTEKVTKALKKCLGKNSTCEGCAYLGQACTDHLLKDCNTVILDLQKQALERETVEEVHNDARVIDELYYRLQEVCRYELISFEDLPLSTIIAFAKDALEDLTEQDPSVPCSTRSVKRQLKLLTKFIKKWGTQNDGDS